MATLVVTQAARTDLQRLIETRHLPASTRARVRLSLRPLHTFPLLGYALSGRWKGFRIVLGPWPWMLIVYRYDSGIDTVTVVTIQDSRTVSSATGE